MTRFTSVAILFAASAAAAGCKMNGDADTASAEGAIDSTDSASSESAFLTAAMDGSETATGFTAPATPTPQGVADWIDAHVGSRFLPAGCAVASESGLTVKVVFTNCTGPRGLVEVNGEVDFTISAGTSGAIDVAAHAADLQVGAATLGFDSSAAYTVSGTTKSLAVTTQGSGTGPLGNQIIHDGDYTATWDATCVSVDGSWSTSVGEKSRSTTASVMKCENACPSGTITRDTFLGRTITITFDGTNVAKWETSAGRSGTINLPCGS